MNLITDSDKKKDNAHKAGLKIATNTTVTNATNIFSLATKTSGLVTQISLWFKFKLKE